MKRLIWLLQFTLLLGILSARENSFQWQLTFQDEFDGPSLDTKKWNTGPRWGRVDWKGEELQYYAEDAFEFRDGVLRIRADQRSMEGKSYTSGLIETRLSYMQAYGYFEMRAKMPKGQGLWPAFWLLPDKDWPPEIDVLEYLGHKSNTIYMSNHWSDSENWHNSKTVGYTGPDFSEDFHTFAVEWNPGEIIWYVDGVERHRTNTGVPDRPMFVIANLAVGGKWPGSPDSSTPFPSYLEIDYIRLYTRAEFGQMGFLHFIPGIFKSESKSPYPYP
jgi:beta-glucanase (GH16 family)